MKKEKQRNLLSPFAVLGLQLLVLSFDYRVNNCHHKNSYQLDSTMEKVYSTWKCIEGVFIHLLYDYGGHQGR